MCAFERRNAWSAHEHGAFWTGFLPEWPTRGRRPVRDVLSLVVAVLVGDGLSEADAAGALGVEQDSIRPRERSGRRERPSLDRGQDLLAAQEFESYPTRLRRLTGKLWMPELALPRVFALDEDLPEPIDTFWNPLVELLDGQKVSCAHGEQYQTLAQQHLRRMWEARRASAEPSPVDGRVTAQTAARIAPKPA